MKGISMYHILPLFINNTIYKNNPVLQVIQVALAAAEIEEDKIPLTVVSPFRNISNKLGYYYTPAQLQSDWDVGLFLIGEEEFKRAQYGVVRLKLDGLIAARQFLTTAVHEYIHTAQYRKEPEIMKIIGEDSTVVAAKEAEACMLAEKLVGTVCAESWVVGALNDLDKELGWV